MNLGFWGKLKKPIMVLAPMADVTDAAFRQIIIKHSRYGGRDIGNGSKVNLPAEALRMGGPDVMYTEFVSADGLCHPVGREKLLIDLSYTEAERPIVAQLFTGHPDKMREAAALVRELGFDGLDINMGCPDRKVEKQCAGAALMKDPKLARELIRAAREGVGDAIPISVKTRIGYNRDELATWLPELLAEEPTAITIHCRTRKEMSDVPARWQHVAEAVRIRDAFFSSPSPSFQEGDLRGSSGKTLILGNGDVRDLADARAKAQETGADGIMLGRAIFGTPELFSNSRELENSSEEEKVKRKLSMMLEHTKLFEELFKGIKNFAIMKKHFKAYVQGFDGAKELREKLMETQSAEEVENIIKILI